MKHIHYPAFFFALFFAQHLAATTWPVGPNRPHTGPSQVAALVADGDTVAIDPGIYPGDVCTWTANHLVLRGTGTPGQYSHLRADGQNAGGKAIWVIKGDYVRVENIEFSLCQVPDQNGAGIRAEGLHLTVNHCSFHHNEMGILTTNDDNAEFIFEYSEFAYNGYGDGYSHNVYVGSVKSLIFQYNYSHHGKVGHLLKSRAQFNYILYNRLTDEPGADASREIDLPNGGTAIIIGNLIQQSEESQNGNIIGFGMEGLANLPPHTLYIIHNTIVNERFAGRFVQFPAGVAVFKCQNNILTGPGTIMDTPVNPALLDTTNNITINNPAAAGFVDYPNFDYHLTAGSPALDGAVDAGMVDTFALRPVAEYVHPWGSVDRLIFDIPDIGAYEFEPEVGVAAPAYAPAHLTVFPNPSTGDIDLKFNFPLNNQPVQVAFWGIDGKDITAVVKPLGTHENGLAFSLQQAPAGLIVVRVTVAEGRSYYAIVQKM
jgi:hypothetical protein